MMSFFELNTLKVNINVPNFCRNDELSFSWTHYLLTDSEVFILFAENSQILLKISIILILLIFMFTVALYQKNWVVNNIKSSQVNSNSNSTHHCGRN